MVVKDLLGITKLQRDTDIKIALEKLQFLASEMEKDNDRKDDMRFWKESLEVLKHYDNGKSFWIKKVNEAYSLLYRVFSRKHGLMEE